jgi:hypothetical protein
VAAIVKAGATSRESFRVADVPDASVTVTSNAKRPATRGAPSIAPVEEERETPGGNAPPEIDQRDGARPPAAERL